MKIVMVMLLASCSGYEHPKVIMERIKYDRHRDPIIQGNTFTNLPQYGHLMVDKTLLLKDIMWKIEEKIVVISSPIGFGKSISVTMMKFFFEIEVDEKARPIAPNQTAAYRFFKHGQINTSEGIATFAPPPLISKEEKFFDEYQGRYPIIYLDLDANTNLDFWWAMRDVRKAIGECYKQHSYLLNVYYEVLKDRSATDEELALAEKRVKVFRRFTDLVESERLTNGDMAKGLKFLCKMLYDHFGKKVILLIDEYDHVVHEMNEWMYYWPTFTGEPIREHRTMSFFMYMYEYTFKRNKYLEKSVLTSRFPFMVEKLLANVGEYVFYDVLDNDLSEFFGFTKEEVDLLFESTGVPKKTARQAYDWYYGYTYRNSNVTVYNPWSIGRFIRSMEIGNYWENHQVSTYGRDLRKVFIMDELRSDIDSLMEGNTVAVSWTKAYISYDDVQHLAKIFTKKFRIFEKEKELIFKRLFVSGYLAYAGMKREPRKRRTMLLRMANKEVYALLARIYEIDIQKRYPWTARGNYIYHAPFWEEYIKPDFRI